MRNSLLLASIRSVQQRSARGKVMSRHHARRSGGFTLIEVIIAMAIFVVGAVAIVRIFPPALGVIQNSESRAIATHEARSVLAKWSSDPQSVPDWVYDADQTINDERTAMLGTTIRTSSLPTRPDPQSTGSALGRFKRIEGEKHRVIQEAGGNKFIFTDFAYEPTTDPLSRVTLTREYALDGVRIVESSGDYYFDFSGSVNSATGASWANTGDPRFPQGLGGNYTYYVSYRWISGTNQVNAVVDEPYIIPDVTFPASDYTTLKPLQERRIPSAAPTSATIPKSIIEGEVSVRVVEKIDPLLTAAPQSGDHFRGLVTLVPTFPANPGELIGVNYTVLDWSWMIYDGPLSNPAGPLPDTMPTPVAPEKVQVVTLPIRGLNDGFDPGAWMHTALMPAPGDGVTPVAPRRDKWGPPAPTANFHVNDKRSDVLFKYNSATVKSPRVRIAYRTQDSWARQVTVASRSYVPFFNNSDFQASGSETAGARPLNAFPPPPPAPAAPPPRQTWREYLWNTATPRVIYFYPSEAGKTVMVSFKYQETVAGVPVTRTVTNAVITIDDEIISSPDLAFGKLVSQLELLDSKGLPVAATAILGIRGLSVHARTAWVDNGRYNQSVASGYRRSDL